MGLIEGKEYWIKAKFLGELSKSPDDGPHIPEIRYAFRVGIRETSIDFSLVDFEAIEAFPEREKVVIPKFVADWIEYCEKEKFWNLHDAYINMSERLQNWRFKGNNSEIFARAWLDGYEIEKEPLYWVRNAQGLSLLKKMLGDVICCSGGYNEEFQAENKGMYTFTEKEIKDYDERYWAFAVSVEE